MKKNIFVFVLLHLYFITISQTDTLPYVQILGIAQDGGYPHFGCEKTCCKIAWADTSRKKFVVSLAIVDPKLKKWWLLEATPDIKEQINYFSKLTQQQYPLLPEGILITHAHIGHYAGLIHLGKEVMNTSKIPVYVMSQMKLFLEKNAPWSQLVSLNNITLTILQNELVVKLSNAISIKPILVPHRDEFSETIGFKILTSSKNYLFIPDIDKWEKWTKSIINEVKTVDVAFLDATFNSENELKNRKLEEVPHPFIQESVLLFKNESASIKNKIFFIHFNHTNPLMWDAQYQTDLKKKGFNVATQGSKH